MGTWCVYFGAGEPAGGGKGKLFLGHRLCYQKTHTERRNVSQGHTLGEGEDPEILVLLQKSVLVGVGGMLEGSPGTPS